MCAAKHLIYTALFIAIWSGLAVATPEIPPEKQLMDIIKEYKAKNNTSLRQTLKSDIFALLKKYPARQHEIINWIDKDGMAPILWFGDDIEMIKFLLDLGAIINIQNSKLVTFAIGAGQAETLNVLLQNYCTDYVNPDLERDPRKKLVLTTEAIALAERNAGNLRGRWEQDLRENNLQSIPFFLLPVAMQTRGKELAEREKIAEIVKNKVKALK